MSDRYFSIFFHIKHKWLQTLEYDNIKLHFFSLFTSAEVKISLGNSYKCELFYSMLTEVLDSNSIISNNQ